MIKKILLLRINHYIDEYKKTNNDLVKVHINGILNELDYLTLKFYNAHFINLKTYLEIEKIIDNKEE